MSSFPYFPLQEPSPTDTLTLVIAVEKSPTLTFPLKSKNKDPATTHRMFLLPYIQAYEKAKSADDTKYTKVWISWPVLGLYFHMLLPYTQRSHMYIYIYQMELDIAVHKASIQESEHKFGVLQAEVEPMTKSSKQALEDARAAKEQCDGLSLCLSLSLISPSVCIFLLSIPSCTLSHSHTHTHTQTQAYANEFVG